MPDTPLTFEQHLGEVYKRAILQSDQAGADRYLADALADEALETEARTYVARAETLAANSGGGLARRCFTSHVRLETIKAALALRAEGA
jgi:hypothetical protein